MIKTDTLVIIAAAALGLYFIARVVKKQGSESPESTGAGRATALPVPGISNTGAYAKRQGIGESWNGESLDEQSILNWTMP
jgi:hypothetical protein